MDGFGPTLCACTYPGCAELVPGALYCAAHRPARTKTEAGYDSRFWRESREWIRQHPQCVRCGRRANTVDHIVPARSGIDFYDKTNWRSLCQPCHTHVTRTTTREWEPRYGRWNRR